MVINEYSHYCNYNNGRVFQFIIKELKYDKLIFLGQNQEKKYFIWMELSKFIFLKDEIKIYIYIYIYIIEIELRKIKYDRDKNGYFLSYKYTFHKELYKIYLKLWLFTTIDFFYFFCG